MVTSAQKKAMKEGVIGVDKFKFHKDGTVTAIRSYFYRFGMTPESIFAKVKEEFQTAEMVDSGDHFHAFVGGADTGSAKDSFMWVRFKV